MMAARRVLLVDDEPRIVAGLQRLLRPHRATWDVTIATSAHDALALMANASFDVVVSDMRMPVMDGAAFLTVAKASYPGTMRIILSGQTDAEAAIRVIPVAHQFLSKPTEPALLLETLQRVSMMQTEIADPRVRAAIGGIDVLPSLPSVCHELTRLLANDDVSIVAVAEAVQSDPAIVAKLLQVVNSSFFGARRHIASVADAIAYLGTEQLENLVLSIAVVSCLPARAVHFDATAFHHHSIAVAKTAQLVAGKGELASTIFACGLLHDIGKLAMASTMPDLYDAIAARCQATGASFEDVEIDLGSCGHAKLGACFLDLWGIPFQVVEAVIHQAKAPAIELDSSRLRTWDAVHVAHRLLERAGEAFDSDEGRAYLGRLDLLERLPELVASVSEPATRK